MNNSAALEAIQSFETDTQRVCYRAIGNSASYRLLNVIDQMHTIQTALEAVFNPTDPGADVSCQQDRDRLAELGEQARVLRALRNSCANINRHNGGDDFWQPQAAKDILLFIGQPKTAQADLDLLSQLSGKSVDELRKMQSAVIIAEARRGQALATRIGDEFENFVEHDTFDTCELESGTDFVRMDVAELCRTKLKAAMDSSLKKALAGQNSGLSNFVFFKDAVMTLSHL